MGYNNVETITLNLYDQPCNIKEEGVIPLELIIDDEYKKKYVVKDHNIKFCREKDYKFIIFDVDGQTISGKCCIIINDTEYNCVSDNESFLLSHPFIDSLGAAQIQVKYNTLCYCSDCYLVESYRKDDINDEANAAITYIAEHYPELFKEDPRISFIGTKIGSRSIAERTLKRQMLKDTRKVYERSYAYMRNSPYTRIRNIDEVVPVSKMQSVTPRTVKYIASHTNCLVPAQKGIKYGNRYCQPAKVLSEQKERTFDVYENRVVMGFLKTILQEIQSMISDTQKEIDSLPGSEERNRLEKERDDLIDIRSKYVNTQKKYGDIFRINARALRALPKPTPALTATNAYREIYQEIRKWFNGTFVANFCKTLMKFLSTSKLYEYYLLSKMLVSINDLLLPQNYTMEADNIDYLHFDPDVNPKTYTQTRVADVFKYTNGENELTLYYQPVIKRNDSKILPNGLWLFNNYANVGYYMPDYVFKLRNGNSVRYIILDAKYSRPSSFKEGTDKLKEMISKYIHYISFYFPSHISDIKQKYSPDNDREKEYFEKWCSEDIRFQKKIGMIILCGQKEDNCTSSVGRSDYEQYAVLPAVASAEYNRSSAPNMVDNVVQYVVDSFFQPLNVNGPNKPPITLPDLSFQDYFKKR